MTSHTHGYNETNSDWERITSTNKQLSVKDASAIEKLTEIATNTSTSGSATIIQGLTDISDSGTNTNLLCDTDGHLKVDVNNSVAVTGTFYPTTQPVSGSVSVGNFPTTQPVSGTVSVNTISGFATENTVASVDNKITQGEGSVSGGGNGLQQILCYGKDQSGNLDPLNVDNNGHLKVTLNDIESNITSSINVVPNKEQPIDAIGTNTALITQMVANSKEGTNSNDVFTLTCNRDSLSNNVSLHTQSARYSASDSNSTVTDGSYFDSVNVGQAKNFNAFFLTGNSTGSLTGSMILEGSNDNSNWIPVYDIYEMSHGGSTVALFEVTNITYGFQYYRVKNNTGSNVTLTNGQYNYFN